MTRGELDRLEELVADAVRDAEQAHREFCCSPAERETAARVLGEFRALAAKAVAELRGITPTGGTQ